MSISIYKQIEIKILFRDQGGSSSSMAGIERGGAISAKAESTGPTGLGGRDSPSMLPHARYVLCLYQYISILPCNVYIIQRSRGRQFLHGR